MSRFDLTTLELRTVHKRPQSDDAPCTPTAFASEEVSTARALGILVHAMLEHAVDARKNISPEFLIRKAFSEVPEYDFTQFPHLHDKAQQIVDFFRSSSAWSSINDEAIKFHPELRYYSRVGDFLSQGQMDLVIEKPVEVWVVDYKTSPREIVSLEAPSSEVQTYRSQVQRYIRTTQKLFPRHARCRGFLCWVMQGELEEVLL